MDDTEFKATFWKPLGPNFRPAREVWKSFPGNSKEIVEMLKSDMSAEELGKVLHSLLMLRDYLSLIMKNPHRAGSLRNLDRFLRSMAKRDQDHSMSQAERDERKRMKEASWEMQFETLFPNDRDLAERP